MARESAAGGPGTIGGIVYQILSRLLRSLRVYLESGKFASPTSELTLLILERSGGGRDLQVVGEVIEIEQLKAKADGVCGPFCRSSLRWTPKTGPGNKLVFPGFHFEGKAC